MLVVAVVEGVEEEEEGVVVAEVEAEVSGQIFY